MKPESPSERPAKPPDREASPQAPTKIPNSPPRRARADDTTGPGCNDPPLRLAHVLFVLWVAGSVSWALYAAQVAYDLGWWDLKPDLAAGLVLAPPVLAHILAILIIRITGNPRFR